MVLGQLNAVVDLHRPHKTYYGNRESNIGDIVLTYIPKTKKATKDQCNVDLFGPLRVEVIFEGSFTIRIPEQTDDSREYSKARRISRIIHCIYDGLFRCAPDQMVRLPFGLRFPEMADSYIDFRTGLDISDRLLPPSMRSFLPIGTSVRRRLSTTRYDQESLCRASKWRCMRRTRPVCYTNEPYFLHYRIMRLRGVSAILSSSHDNSRRKTKDLVA